MKFAREPYSDRLAEEMKPLWEKHYTETRSENYPKLEPDLAVYHEADERRMLRIYTARQNGCLVGYQVFFISRHPHHRQSIQAEQDILFFTADSRKGLVGYKFIRYCIGELMKEKIDMIHQRISVRNNFGQLFERLGFKLEDLTYSRRV